MKQPAKKKGAAKKMGEEAKLREEFTNKGPLRLRKYAITGLNIPAEIVDGWNDFNYMVDYCVAKALGNEPPEGGEEDEQGYDESSNEFDASGMVDDDNDDDDGDSDGYDDEMEEGGDGMFADPDEEPEQEPDPEPEPEPAPKVAKKRQTKKKAPAPPAEAGDMEVQLQGMLDVITNQGTVLDTMKKDLKVTKSTIEEVYVRQQASHKAIAVIAKTVFQVSTYISEFVPRALKAMKFKPNVSKQMKSAAETASKDAEELVAGLLDPEAD